MSVSESPPVGGTLIWQPSKLTQRVKHVTWLRLNSHSPLRRRHPTYSIAGCEGLIPFVSLVFQSQGVTDKWCDWAQWQCHTMAHPLVSPQLLSRNQSL